MKLLRLLIGILCGVQSVGIVSAKTFSVLAYNVENLFDVDGVAAYSDYRQYGIDNVYTPRQLLTKIEHIGEVLSSIDGGRGPDVVLFQEIEADQTPYSSWDWRNPERFLAEWKDNTVEQMLTEKFSDKVRGLPSEAFLYKYLNDIGLKGYEVALGAVGDDGRVSAQKNVIFTRFPVVRIEQRALAWARDLIIAELEVEGHPFIVMNNHWKSGASNMDLEPVRVQNAGVVRAALEEILLNNPGADVLLAGDFNSYYNQSAVFPDLKKSGINDVLGSQIDEKSMVEADGSILYNLWGEMEKEERGSEVYRGYWGTLMQMLITRGLYDFSGIQYVDNSFERIILPRKNVETHWLSPKPWANLGDGAGYSDHLPILARFRTMEKSEPKRWMELTDTVSLTSEPGYRLPVDYARLNGEETVSSGLLDGLDTKGILGYLYEIIHIVGTRTETGVLIGDREIKVYAEGTEVRDRLNTILEGAELRGYGQLIVYKGELELIIRDPSWLTD